MKYYGKSKSVIDEIIENFKNKNFPQKIAPIFVNRNDDIPSIKWSYLNKINMIINNTNDARGFNQWNSVGRKVKKGGRAFYILGPCIKVFKKDEVDKKTGKKRKKDDKILYGFKSIPVFRIEDTEIVDEELWTEHNKKDLEEEKRLQNLPLREVAEKWGLEITSYNGKNSSFLGYYQHNKKIAVGVKNLNVFCHELIHAADDKLGNLIKQKGQNSENEIVAEIGSCVLLRILGFDDDIDIHSSYDYVKNYAGNEDKLYSSITKLINRICESVNLIIKESDQIIVDL